MATIGNREETEDCGVRSLLSSRSSRDTTCLVSAKAFFANIARLDSFLFPTSATKRSKPSSHEQVVSLCCALGEARGTIRKEAR